MLGARGDGRAMGGCGSDDEVAVAKSKQKNPGRPKTEINRPCLVIVALCARRCPGNAPDQRYFLLSSPHRAKEKENGFLVIALRGDLSPVCRADEVEKFLC